MSPWCCFQLRVQRFEAIQQDLAVDELPGVSEGLGRRDVSERDAG